MTPINSILERGKLNLTDNSNHSVNICDPVLNVCGQDGVRKFVI